MHESVVGIDLDGDGEMTHTVSWGVMLFKPNSIGLDEVISGVGSY